MRKIFCKMCIWHSFHLAVIGHKDLASYERCRFDPYRTQYCKATIALWSRSHREHCYQCEDETKFEGGIQESVVCVILITRRATFHSF